MRYLALFLVWTALLPPPINADSPDWSEGAVIPITGRPNPYGWSDDAFRQHHAQGRQHALIYPVEVTGTQIPLTLLERIFNPEQPRILRGLRQALGLGSFESIESWLGLVPYGDLPRPTDLAEGYRMGTSLIDHPDLGAQGLTFGCAACHASALFGKPVLGLFNRFSRANEFFHLGKKMLRLVQPIYNHATGGLSVSEKAILDQMRTQMARVGVKRPGSLGLDTSLAQVALSLARRQQDGYASPSPELEQKPRPEPLLHRRADSKPGTWWVLKYKNRWLLDGSVISGNPIYTNLLWNEIGRGTDLEILADWLDNNQDVIQDLTTFVFATPSPRYEDFFGLEALDIQQAQEGQRLFRQTCKRCHGDYVKGWENPDVHDPLAKLATTQVRYFSQTPVMDVGTDPLRYQGMTSLTQLNDLDISKQHQVLVQPQRGYVPPPLEGIWARWPYFHNNAVPTLCDVLTRPEQRPRSYKVIAPVDPKTDFDQACNGYPRRGQARATYQTWREGQSNSGHAEGIFLRSGEEIFTPEQKMALIAFLKTL